MSVLTTLRAEGLVVEAAGDTVRAGPRERLTDELRELIRRHKSALLAELRAEVDPLAELYAEIFAGMAPTALVTLTGAQVARAIHLGALPPAPGGEVVVAYRNAAGQCLLTIPAARYDGLALLNLMEGEGLKKQLQTPRPAPAPATLLEFQAPAEERAAWNDGLAEAGRMIAEFADRQAERAQVKAELAQQPAYQNAAATYRAILGHLQAADAALATANELAYFDMAFGNAAMNHASRIRNFLERLA